MPQVQLLSWGLPWRQPRDSTVHRDTAPLTYNAVVVGSLQFKEQGQEGHGGTLSA